MVMPGHTSPLPVGQVHDALLTHKLRSAAHMPVVRHWKVFSIIIIAGCMVHLGVGFLAELPLVP